MANTSIASRNKIRIAQQFSRAANTYDSAAEVQLDIAFDAMSYLPSHYKSGLDIGCGTGRISQQLSNRCERLVAMDLAFGMLSYAQQNNALTASSICWLQGDADSLPMADNSVDMLYSSMVLQWTDNQQKVMSEINRVMDSGATAILAIMCDGSFTQLNESWLSIDKRRHVNNFSSAQSWRDAAISQGLQVNMHEKQYVTWHQNINKLLCSIKSIGANVVLKSQNSEPTDSTISLDKIVFNRQGLQHLETYYRQKYAENMQLPLTYQVCFLHCKK
jgi:malonyl-CoA O-methyltransferase